MIFHLGDSCPLFVGAVDGVGWARRGENDGFWGLRVCKRCAQAANGFRASDGVGVARFMQKNVLIVIPAKNEVDTIGRVVEEIRASCSCPVVVVDDGSSDGTAEAARSAGAVVLKPVLPLGAWGATQAGIRFALALGSDVVITMDADGQHESEAVPDLLNLLGEHAADVVIGACPQRASLLRKMAWGIFRRMSGFAFEDLTSGFRAYNRAAIEVLASEEATLLDYQDIGVLILLRKAGLRIAEVPVPMYPRMAGRSRIFSSWLAVGWYMAKTAILCLARWRIEKRGA